WSDARITKAPAAKLRTERQKALEYIERHKGSAFAWALLGFLQDRAGPDQAIYQRLAEAWRLFEDRPALAFAARYEAARCLFKAGNRAEARKRFRAMYEKTLKDGFLPAVDTDFRLALQGGSDTADAWTDLLRRTAEGLVKEKRRPAVLALARQCWQLDDP